MIRAPTLPGSEYFTIVSGNAPDFSGTFVNCPRKLTYDSFDSLETTGLREDEGFEKV